MTTEKQTDEKQTEKQTEEINIPCAGIMAGLVGFGMYLGSKSFGNFSITDKGNKMEKELGDTKMSKFKVGDIVKDISTGEIGTVIGSFDRNTEVKFKDNNFYLYSDDADLELKNDMAIYTITVPRTKFPFAPGLKVVVRDANVTVMNDTLWKEDYFLFKVDEPGQERPFQTSQDCYGECYPFDTHSHLIGTTYPADTPACSKCGKAAPKQTDGGCFTVEGSEVCEECFCVALEKEMEKPTATTADGIKVKEGDTVWHPDHGKGIAGKNRAVFEDCHSLHLCDCYANPPEHPEFKPFQRVLVRNSKKNYWEPYLFSYRKSTARPEGEQMDITPEEAKKPSQELIDAQNILFGEGNEQICGFSCTRQSIREHMTEKELQSWQRLATFYKKATESGWTLLKEEEMSTGGTHFDGNGNILGGEIIDPQGRRRKFYATPKQVFFVPVEMIFSDGTPVF